MSDPRDEACAKKVYQETWHDISNLSGGNIVMKALIEAARLGRENWTPTDPLLVRAREVCASLLVDATGTATPQAYLEGKRDDHPWITLALAALREGIRMAKETSDV